MPDRPLNPTSTTQTQVAIEDALASTMTDKRVEVLRAVGRLGSISEAARANAVSYKAAWQAIETLSNLAGVPLIDKAVGGAGGGGARLTPDGRALLAAADRLSQARATALAQIRGEVATGSVASLNVANIGFRMSMRNQIPCIVHAIEKVAGAPRIWLELADGQQLASRITAESLELLDLKPGQPVIALCKATAVTIAPTIVAIGEVSVIRGTVASRLDRKRDGQMTLVIGQNTRLSGFVQSTDQLRAKQVAMAAIAESAVVIGLAD